MKRKSHPATREILPQDPLDLRGVAVPGDTDRMLRLLVEEYARIGWGTDQLMGLAKNPFYRAFHGLLGRYGEQGLRRRIEAVLGRTGVTRVKTLQPEARPARSSQERS